MKLAAVKYIHTHAYMNQGSQINLFGRSITQAGRDIWAWWCGRPFAAGTTPSHPCKNETFNGVGRMCFYCGAGGMPLLHHIECTIKHTALAGALGGQ